LENVIVPANKTASAYKLFHGEDCKGLNHLHIFGEVAVVKGSNKIQSKLKNKACLCSIVALRGAMQLTALPF